MKLAEAKPFKWKVPHHGYMGLFLVFMTFTMSDLSLYSGIRIPILIVGTALILDDCIEHTITRTTPFRLLFEIIIVPILRRR